MSGSAIAQVLALLALPVITRLFAPEDFGILGIFLAVIGIIGVMVCLRYELTILLPKNENDAAHLYWLSLASACVVTVLSLFIVAFYTEPILEFLNAPGLEPYVWFIPAGIFLKGLHTANSHWNTRRAMFGRLATVDVGNSLITNGSKILFGVFGLISGGILILSNLLGTTVAAMILGRNIYREDRKFLLKGIRWKRGVTLIREYKNISLFNTTGSLFNMFSQKAPLLLLTWLFNPAVAGYYLLADQLLKKPANFVIKAIKNVFFKKASTEQDNPKKLAEITGLLTEAVTLFGLGFVTLMITIAGPFAVIILGENWVSTGQFIQWLSLYILILFVTNPISSLVTIKRKEHIVFFLHIGEMVLKLGALLIGGLYFKDPLQTIILFSVVSFFYSLCTVPWLFSLSNSSVFRFFRVIGFPFLVSGITVAISLILLKGEYFLSVITINLIYAALYSYLTKETWIPVLRSVKP